ncbi:MAG: lipid A biosynthesis acyltransferase [Acidobacteriota bacterium]
MPRALRRRLRQRFAVPTAGAARFVFGSLPWSWAQAVGATLGRLLFMVAKRDRGRALDHVAIAFPELSAAEKRDLVKASYRHLGIAAAELLHLWGRDPSEAQRHVTVEGFEHVETLRREGRPILIVTGHCGNWELISCANASHGLGLAAIARELDDPDAQGMAVALRQHLGSETIARGSKSAARQLLRTLRRRGSLALLIDQDLKVEGVWVPFFGRLAHTPGVAAEMSGRLGAGVIPTFSERLTDGRHRICFDPPLDLPDDVVEATALLTARIEAHIRRRPEQWVWFHRRWRRRPPEESAPEAPGALTKA